MIYDVSDPVNPVYVACNGDDGYVHDAQCVIYTGPDADYNGNEVSSVTNTILGLESHVILEVHSLQATVTILVNFLGSENLVFDPN